MWLPTGNVGHLIDCGSAGCREQIDKTVELSRTSHRIAGTRLLANFRRNKFADAGDPEHRKLELQRISVAAEKYNLAACTLLPPLLCDDDPWVVSTAMLDYIALCHPEPNGLPFEFSELNTFFTKGTFESPGGAIGGLIPFWAGLLWGMVTFRNWVTLCACAATAGKSRRRAISSARSTAIGIAWIVFGLIVSCDLMAGLVASFGKQPV